MNFFKGRAILLFFVYLYEKGRSITTHVGFCKTVGFKNIDRHSKTERFWDLLNPCRVCKAVGGSSCISFFSVLDSSENHEIKLNNYLARNQSKLLFHQT